MILAIRQSLLRSHQTLPSTHKVGYQWRYEVRNYFYRHSIHLEARELGAAGDDLFNDSLSIECKNHREWQLSTWLDQTVKNAGSKFPILTVKRKGKGVAEGYAIMRMSDLVALLVYAARADS